MNQGKIWPRDPEKAHFCELYESASPELRRLVSRFLRLALDSKSFYALWLEAEETKDGGHLSAEEIAELIARWELKGARP